MPPCQGGTLDHGNKTVAELAAKGMKEDRLRAIIQADPALTFDVDCASLKVLHSAVQDAMKDSGKTDRLVLAVFHRQTASLTLSARDALALLTAGVSTKAVDRYAETVVEDVTRNTAPVAAKLTRTPPPSCISIIRD